MRPVVYAHRGGLALAPENTTAAFDNGLACGADGLEFDVHLSSDGVPVIIHDATVDRTTDGTGAVADLTAAELAALDAACRFERQGRFPFRGRGLGVPALGDLLERYAGVPLLVELKIGEPRLAHTVVDMIRRAGVVEHVTIGSFHDSALDAVRAYAPEFRTGADIDEIKDGVTATLFERYDGPLRFHAFQVPEVFAGSRVVTPEFVARAHEAGVGVIVWTINDPPDIRRLLDWGVDGLITDRPDVARATITAYLNGRPSGGEL